MEPSQGLQYRMMLLELNRYAVETAIHSPCSGFIAGHSSTLLISPL